MTIAGCFLTPGGVVLGADSTQTFHIQGTERHFDHAQKLFEIGEKSTLGFVTWGFGGNINVSYRTMVAELSDSASSAPFTSVQDACQRWISNFWNVYSKDLAALIGRVHVLEAKPNRSAQEDAELQTLMSHGTAGFCIAGYVPPSRTPEAFIIQFTPNVSAPPKPVQIQMGHVHFFGAPYLIQRLTHGIDPGLANDLVASPLWNGSHADLLALIQPYYLGAPELQLLPIREAIDYVHSVISTTSKGLKFSRLAPVCGGSIEIAAITTDRRFRWITHKSLGQAIES